MQHRISGFLGMWGLEKVVCYRPSEAKVLVFWENDLWRNDEAEELGEWLDSLAFSGEPQKVHLPDSVHQNFPQLSPANAWWAVRPETGDSILLMRFRRGQKPRSAMMWKRLTQAVVDFAAGQSQSMLEPPPGDILTDFILSAGESSSLDDLLWNLYRHISKLIPVDAFFFGFLNPDGRSLDLVFVLDEGRRFPRVIEPVYRGIGSQAVVERRPLLVNRTPEEVETLRRERRLNTFGDHSRISASLLAIPVFLRDRLIGVLSAQSYEFNAYRKSDLQLLQPLVSHFAVALENARLFRDQQRQMKIFSLAEHLQERAWRNQDLRHVIDELVTRIVEETGHPGCGFFYREAEGDGWTVRLMIKDRPRPRKSWKVRQPEKKSELLAEVLSLSRPRIFGNVEKGEWLSRIFEFAPQSLLVVPMKIEREISGLLVIAEEYHQGFSAADAQWFEHLLTRAAVIFQRHRFMLELEKERDRLMDILDHLGEGVQILDRNYRVVYQNRWTAEHLSIDSEAKECYKNLFGLSEPCAGCPVFDGGKTSLPHRFEFVDDLGRCLEIWMIEFQSQEGESQILQIIRDVTRDKRLEEERRRVEKLETAVALAGGIAHELNQPLTGIIGLASLALEDMQEQDFNYECLQQIREQAERMRDLIRKFQDITKFEKMKYADKEIFDLRRSIE